MDHFRQIPQVGRPWDDFLESYTTLAFLAACTERVRLGALVTGITYRNVAHLGKIVATLDVLSGGRASAARAGLVRRGARGLRLAVPPSPSARPARGRPAAAPLLWGRAPAFEGKVLDVPEALCYPRPLQEHVPILVGAVASSAPCGSQRATPTRPT